MLKEYKDDCRYLRKKFNLHLEVSIYDLVGRATDFIREADDKAELEQLDKEQSLVEEKPKCQTTKKKKVLKSKSKKKLLKK